MSRHIAVTGCGGGHRKCGMGSGRHQIAHQCRCCLVGFTRAETRHLFPRHIALRAAHFDRPGMRDLQPRPRQGQRNLGDADAISFQRHRHQCALARFQRARQGHITAMAIETRRPCGREADAVAAGLALHIVEIERGGGMIARRQETRQHQIGHHRIAHGQRAVGMPHLVGSESDRHQAQFAVEVRHIGRNGSLAAGADRDKAREQRHRARRHHGQRAAAETITAFAQRTDGALFWFDQAAVIIAHTDAEPALAEIIAGRIGRLKFGQLQNAFVNSGEGDIGAFPCRQTGDGDRNRNLLPRRNLFRHGHLDAERARAVVDAQPDNADGTHGFAGVRLRQTAIMGDEHIGACAPIGRDRNIDGGARRR